MLEWIDYERPKNSTNNHVWWEGLQDPPCTMVIRNTVTTLRNSLVVSSVGQGSEEVELSHDSNGEDKVWNNRSWGRARWVLSFSWHKVRRGNPQVHEKYNRLHKATLWYTWRCDIQIPFKRRTVSPTAGSATSPLRIASVTESHHTLPGAAHTLWVLRPGHKGLNISAQCRRNQMDHCSFRVFCVACWGLWTCIEAQLPSVFIRTSFPKICPLHDPQNLWMLTNL